MTDDRIVPTRRVIQLADFRPSWMLVSDLHQVLAIERESFEFPWTERDFRWVLQRRNCIGLVVRHRERSIAGCAVYALHATRVELLNLAVAADCRRLGIGTLLIRRLCGRLATSGRRSLGLEVRESNLPAQLFYRRLGFTCLGLRQGWYDEIDEAALRFVWRVGQKAVSEQPSAFSKKADG